MISCGKKLSLPELGEREDTRHGPKTKDPQTICKYDIQIPEVTLPDLVGEWGGVSSFRLVIYPFIQWFIQQILFIFFQQILLSPQETMAETDIPAFMELTVQWERHIHNHTKRQDCILYNTYRRYKMGIRWGLIVGSWYTEKCFHIESLTQKPEERGYRWMFREWGEGWTHCWKQNEQRPRSTTQLNRLKGHWTGQHDWTTKNRK